MARFRIVQTVWLPQILRPRIVIEFLWFWTFFRCHNQLTVHSKCQIETANPLVVWPVPTIFAPWYIL